MALIVGTNTLDTPRIWHPMVSFCWDLITPGTSSLVEQEHTTALHSIPSLMWWLWRPAFFRSAFLRKDGPTLENMKLRIHFNHWILCFIIFKRNSSLLLQYYFLHCIYILMSFISWGSEKEKVIQILYLFKYKILYISSAYQCD